MIKPNLVIYSYPYISEEKLRPYEPKLKKLESQTNTTISFDFVEQCFNIEGESQESCFEVENIIQTHLLPIFNKQIDKWSMTGTYQDVQSMKQTTPKRTLDVINVVGRPLRLEHADFDDDKSYLPVETEEYEQIIVKEFHVSPKINDIPDFLIGPPQYNMQLAEYMDIIPNLSNTVCALKGRCIIITGEETCVDDAFSRFKALEKSYIAHFKTSIALCVHNPNPSVHYDLCFCELNSFKHRSLVQKLLKPSQLSNYIYILLPVIFNSVTKAYEKPKDFIELTASGQRERYITEQQDIERKQLKEKELNDAFSLCNIKLQETSSYVYASPNRSPPKPVKVEYVSKKTRNTNYHNRENMQKDYTISDSEASTSLSTTPPSVYEFETFEIPENNISNFPALAPKKTKKTLLSPEKKRVNRVIRIVPHKSSPTTLTMPNNPSVPLADRVKSYNYFTIKNSLTGGLNALRGFKGEIKLSAKIGKVFLTNVSQEAKSQVWKYEDLNDIAVKEHGVKPQFSEITTTDISIIDCMASILPNAPYNKTSIYEFHCSARNSPSLPYRNVVVHMNQGVIDVRKVVLREKKTTAINWICLDRKFDFQLSITTKVLTRCDVKPYTTFINKISVCPITLVMTFEEVPRFLTVKYILLKDTTRFKIISPFIVEITRVEKVVIQNIANSNKMRASPGTGNVWFDFEVRNVENDKVLQVNKDLEIGKEAEWTADDILRLTDDRNQTDIITEYVTYLLYIIEELEKEISKNKM